VISQLGETLKKSKSRVLVTGHTGFKGTWLTLLLENLGIEVFGLALPPQRDSLYSTLNRTGKISEYFTDIRNQNALRPVLHEIRPDVIFHLAAQPLVFESYRTPVDTFATNVMGTAHILEEALGVESVKSIGVVTTDKVYRNQNFGVRFKESDALGGKDPYSASKTATESVVQAWRQLSRLKNGPKIVSLRAGNVIGGGDFSESRLVPDIIRGLLKSEIVEIRNPNSTRPWQHVLDPLVGYIYAIEQSLRKVVSDEYNFGPDKPSLEVAQVIEIAQRMIPNLQVDVKTNSKLSEFESVLLDLNSELAKDELGWTPIWSQEQAIEKSLEWWLRKINYKDDPLFLCRRDIEEYLRGVK
jgi:CDP-glucose 4,6-dehydratase